MSATQTMSAQGAAIPVPTGLADSGWFEAAAAFTIFAPVLFVPQLTTAGVALSFGCTGLYAWAHRRDAPRALLRRWPLLLIPAYALASVIWSDYPDVSLKHAMELWVTVVGGLLLSASRRPAHLLLGVALAFGLFLAASLAFGHSVTVTEASSPTALGTSFTGLNWGKNLLGATAAMGVVSTVFGLAFALRRGWPIAVAFGLVLLALELYLTYLARSAGATIALALALIAFAVTACLGAIPPRRRLAVCAALVLVLAAGGLFGYAFADSVTATVLDVFHKDPTLTGRSYLWYRAIDFIGERPVLGHGYEAFWVQGNLDAEGLWQFAQVSDRMGFNFHNTPIELLIHFGWIGAALVGGVLLYGCGRLLRRAAAEPSLVAAFYIALVVFQVARMPMESLTPSPVDFGTLLMMAAVGFGFEPLAPRAKTPRPRAWRRPAVSHRYQRPLRAPAGASRGK